MGVALTELLLIKEISVDFLQNKTLVVDSPMWMYQFLSNIRQRDGTLLMDSKGSVTSHLMGLMSRIPNLAEQNIKLAFVFDGVPPKLKHLTLERRKETKIEAMKSFEKAKEAEDAELMKKYASRTSRLTQEMISEAKKLILALGYPVINAPSEAEAQASLIVKQDDAFALATNDADALLFGSPRIVRNLNMVGKRKKSSKLAYETITPDLIVLEDNLNHLEINTDQLIALAMLIGTDYNPGGIKGIGPRGALKIVKRFGNNLEALFNEVKWVEHFEFPWQEVFDTIKDIPTTKNYRLEWKPADENEVMKLLVDHHDFSAERVKSQLEALSKSRERKTQKGLNDFFC